VTAHGLAATSGKKTRIQQDYRWVKNVITPYMLIGGSIALSYQLIFDFLHHHEEGNRDQPLYFDHAKALTIIGAFSLGMWGAMPRYWFTGAFIGGMILSPMSWWVY